MESLIPCNNMTVDKAYIITLPDNSISKELTERCEKSCRLVNQPYELWPAFDGTSGELKIPSHLKDQNWINWLKLNDDELSITEIACVFSHFSLWAKCIEINKPLVILEHDAIMVNPYYNHYGYNQIVYLGCVEQALYGWKITTIPPHAQKNTRYRSICRAHAYAVDPHSAKNLVAYVLKYGIHESLDMMIRSDVFSIMQAGLYAYDMPGPITTITNRKKGPDGKER